ncbi:DNA alkylation repair protein [Peptostreptococcus equinus]|uniref:DNA alkylation repair protein n=1 Tax=Peptostreptococcus equinus TaxID=3003601 RepID=A0ABY7JRA8_9FIRM|nr:DNA alkylation repair protein [Peptostreptococcus sp. CBA3647]WAW14708.1 DNA alkylation repair protein [Peptostreptococcus sp. CBA3647]
MIAVKEELFKLQDLSYRDFAAKLIPNIDKEKIIGVRVPVLRKFANEFIKSSQSEEFINELPHQYFEEYFLHCQIVASIKDFDKLIIEVEKILPYIDNWSTCDSFSPKLFKKYPVQVLDKIMEWIKSNHPYTVRFAIVTLMNNYLDDNFREDMLYELAKIKSDHYYINMAIAWYYSYAIIKQYDMAIKLIEDGKLDKFVHNKSIQKAIESRRVPDHIKNYLRTLRKK